MPDDSAQPFLDTTPPHWVGAGAGVRHHRRLWAGRAGRGAGEGAGDRVGALHPGADPGTDPVRAVKSGVLVEVRVAEGDNVTRGSTLFLLRSASMSDRAADRLTLESQLRANEQRLTILKSQYDTRRRSDEAEGRRLANRIQFLEGLISSKSKRLALTKELADSSSSGAKRGAIGKLEASRLELEYSTLQEEVEGARNDLEEARSDITRLERGRQGEGPGIRGDPARSYRSHGDRPRSGPRPSSGIWSMRPRPVSRWLPPATGRYCGMHVNAAGAVVQEGDILSEMACAGDRLQGELRVPEAGVAQVRPGQGVKLRYDAFPYQRYGVRFATVRWLGPAGSTARDSGEFRALRRSGGRFHPGARPDAGLCFPAWAGAPTSWSAGDRW